MGASEWQQTCYLVEWYRPSITGELLDHTIDQLDECAASLSSKGSLVHILMTLAVPTDDVVFGVFEADSTHNVASACDRAGIPAQRVTAVDARVVHQPENVQGLM